jgi:hypothetical protein
VRQEKLKRKELAKNGQEKAIRKKISKIITRRRNVKQERIRAELIEEQEPEQDKLEITTSSSSEFDEYDDDYKWGDNEEDDPDYVYVEEEEDWNEEQIKRVNKEKPTFKRDSKYDKELQRYTDCLKE